MSQVQDGRRRGANWKQVGCGSDRDRLGLQGLKFSIFPEYVKFPSLTSWQGGKFLLSVCLSGLFYISSGVRLPPSNDLHTCFRQDSEKPVHKLEFAGVSPRIHSPRLKQVELIDPEA